MAAGDRFVSVRSLNNSDSSLRFSSLDNNRGGSDGNDTSPPFEQYKRDLRFVAFGEEAENITRVLDVVEKKKKNVINTYTNTIPSHKDPLSVLHPSNWLPSNQMKAPVIIPSPRKLPSLPSKMLDAPNIMDDYYINILHWGSNNIVAVALGEAVYLWNATNSEIHMLPLSYEESYYVSSVKWSPGCKNILVGNSSGQIEVFDTETLLRVRSLPGHSIRTSSLSWNPASNETVFNAGYRNSAIVQHDIRSRRAVFKVGENERVPSHTQEVCGLEWNQSGSILASGSNDNKLCLWDVRSMSERPKFKIDSHAAAVKAIAWCPWKSNLLASGGGTSDRCIRFWNTSTGACLNCVDTKSQVCGIQWSLDRQELVSSHGFSDNQIILWDYPSMKKIGELTGHDSRVLYLDKSPDGTKIVSAAGDETLRFWDIWEKVTKPPSSPSVLSHSGYASAPNYKQLSRHSFSSAFMR